MQTEKGYDRTAVLLRENMNYDDYYLFREKIERRERQAAFTEKAYRLGNEINTMIEQQDTGLTQFGITFSEALFNESGSG